MNKRKLHHIWVKLRPISPWYFLALAVLCGVIFVFAYRQTDIKMIQLREAVFQADEQNGDVSKALNELREFVYSHMGANLTKDDDAIRPPIQLKHTYERLTGQERERAAAVNKKVAEDAVRICEARFPAGQLQDGRVPCVQEYITQNSIQEQQTVPKELYQYDFVSPFWSPDLAGWSILAAAVFFMLFVLRFGLEQWLKHQLD